ncbi:uncharacterized protein IL334_005484 [Kwoniella shivajii]|uniref:PHD-type domain-containing protein n=1 Tax=Kwoniella shivajii TaxID=564305 RepID=A0ABZ1D3L1_9TREE|nr:hypothetical protein IL334_005484 [Kwoniella shivajii]
MDVDTPPPPFAVKEEELRDRKGGLPPSPSAESMSSSRRPSLATPHTSAGPSSRPMTSSGSSERPKRNGDGYWKMKEAETKAQTDQPFEVRENTEASPVVPHSTSAVTTEQDVIMTPPTPAIPLESNPISILNPPATAPVPKKRGRKRISPPPLMTTKGISLVFRMPPNATPGPSATPMGTGTPTAASGSSNPLQGSRASTPDHRSNASVLGDDTGSKKKRKSEPTISTSRLTRGRPSPRGTPLSGSPAPANGALSIFAPPPPTDSLPEAIQSSLPVYPADSEATAAVDADAIRRDAAAGFESRLRSRLPRRDGGERTGVSASGKDVRVGGTARTAEKAPVVIPAGKKKGKGKADVEIPNQDFCSACRGIGRFLCCDGCPRSFHFMCLEPPLRIDELPDEETWYCKKCSADREKELKPVPMVFKQLTKKVEGDNPVQFRLPADIRTYFTGVGTATRGEYVDAEEARTKFDRKGFQEDRDPLRQRDGKNRPIACYVCGGSSLPNHSLITDPESTWRQIVSCDYCSLSWHLDCLDPPLSSMPNSGRKWMCPNHAEQALPRRRTVRNDLETIDIESRHQPNNGNIVIVPEPEPPKGPMLDYEDLIINRKKFRVPERIIRLDFWEKVMQKGGAIKPDNFSDTTADSLVSLSEEDMEAANLVLSLLQAPSRPANNQPVPRNNDIDNVEQPNYAPTGPTDPSSSPATPPQPLPSTPAKSSSGGKQPKIVLRMPGLANGNGATPSK